MLYFINRGDCTHFAPGDSADPVYGQLLREAVTLGVEVLPCRFEITPQGISYLGLAEFLPMQPIVQVGRNNPSVSARGVRSRGVLQYARTGVGKGWRACF